MFSPKIKENIEAYKDFNIFDNQGNKIGNVSVNRNSKKELNIVWIGINKKYEGNGYGTAALKSIIDYVKKENIKSVTLEVPTNSPNARHIYEKQGFKAYGEMLGNSDDVWGGLTRMKLEL